MDTNHPKKAKPTHKMVKSKGVHNKRVRLVINIYKLGVRVRFTSDFIMLHNTMDYNDEKK